MATQANPARSFFKELKEKCVPLSRLAIQAQNTATTARDVLRLVEHITEIWTAQVIRDPALLDDKLADYVFFPLSHVIRNQAEYPLRVTEAAVKLMGTLIQHGWKKNMSQDLSKQLLVFLILVISGVPAKDKQVDTPEELLAEGYRTLAIFFRAKGPTVEPLSPEVPEDQSLIPALGHGVSAVLDGLAERLPSAVQLEALECLRSVFASIKNLSALARILPGTVSTLSKILSPPMQKKTPRRVLVTCLGVLQDVLLSVLGDLKIRPILAKMKNTEDASARLPEHAKNPAAAASAVVAAAAVPGDSDELLSPAWLKATVSQVKIALSVVLKLRSHESGEVRSALGRLCVCLLDECHASLAECQFILVESAVMLEDDGGGEAGLQTGLRDLATIYPEIGDCIKTAVYNWITELPRIMQSSHERIKTVALVSIQKGNKLVAALQLDSSTLDDSLGDALRDSMVALMRTSKVPKVLDEIGLGEDMMQSGALVKTDKGLAQYGPVLLGLESQRATREQFGTLITDIGSARLQTKLAIEMLGAVRDLDGDDQIASYWLSFKLLRAVYARSAETDAFLDLSSLEETEEESAVFRELFDFSASILTSHSDAAADGEVDWRLEAIALEVTAFAASRMGFDFRPELIDVLYPITTFLGAVSSEGAPQLRRHAVITLNIVAASCGYRNVSELVIDNVDYMVSSVALRLNTLDVSPASTRVLTMMIQLTGPRLIPFLDDVVAAIFAALDNYHGYPMFVESLFEVLTAVVQEGVKSDQLLLENRTSSTSKVLDHRKKPPEPIGIEGILKTLDQHHKIAQKRAEEEAAHEETRRGRPKEPWGPAHESEAKALLDALDAQRNGRDESPNGEGDDAHDAVNDQPKPSPTPTYTLLTRVATLTQHYLTSPSARLRRSLLGLVATASPALARDEDAFLPLVNDIWPVVLARLRDPEPFVAASACHTLAGLCATAGDFLASRFKSEWWGAGGLGQWLAQAKEQAEKAVRGGAMGSSSSSPPPSSLLLSSSHRREGALEGGGAGSVIVIPGQQTPTRFGGDYGHGQPSSLTASAGGGGGLGRFAQAVQVWDAARGLLVALVAHVRVDDALFDELLELLTDCLPTDEGGARTALEAVNADAVWLAMYQRGWVGWTPAPVMGEQEGQEGRRFMEMERGLGTVRG